MEITKLLSAIGANVSSYQGNDLLVNTPIDGSQIASLKQDTSSEIDNKISIAAAAFTKWQHIPAPSRGDLIRILGNKLREK